MPRHAGSLCLLSYASRIPLAGKRSAEASLSISTSDGNSSERPGDTLSLPKHCKGRVATSLLQLLPCKLIFVSVSSAVAHSGLRATFCCGDVPWSTSFTCHHFCLRISENTTACPSPSAYLLGKGAFPSPGNHGQMGGSPTLFVSGFCFLDHVLLSVAVSHPFSFEWFFLFLNERSCEAPQAAWP